MAANTLGISTGVGNTFSDTGVYYDKRWLERLKPQLHFEDMGSKKPLPKNAGTLMKWRRLNKLSAVTSPLTENTNPAVTQVGTTEVTVEPLTYGQYVQMSKELQWKSINPIADEITDELSDNAALSYDTIVRAALSGNFTNQFAGGAANEAAVADTATLTAAELRKAVYRLRSVSGLYEVPGFEKNFYKGLISPAGIFDLQADSAVGSFIDVNKYSRPEEIMRGEVGMLYGVRLVHSANSGTGTGATSTTFHAYIFGRDAYAISELSGQGMEMIRKEPGPQDTSNPLNMFSTVGWKFVMAAKVLQSSRAIQIYHGSAADN
jgi:N4-gp56 family major capsid protein